MRQQLMWLGMLAMLLLVPLPAPAMEGGACIQGGPIPTCRAGESVTWDSKACEFVCQTGEAKCATRGGPMPACADPAAVEWDSKLCAYVCKLSETSAVSCPVYSTPNCRAGQELVQQPVPADQQIAGCATTMPLCQNIAEEDPAEKIASDQCYVHQTFDEERQVCVNKDTSKCPAFIRLCARDEKPDDTLCSCSPSQASVEGPLPCVAQPTCPDTRMLNCDGDRVVGTRTCLKDATPVKESAPAAVPAESALGCLPISVDPCPAQYTFKDFEQGDFQLRITREVKDCQGRVIGTADCSNQPFCTQNGCYTCTVGEMFQSMGGAQGGQFMKQELQRTAPYVLNGGMAQWGPQFERDILDRAIEMAQGIAMNSGASTTLCQPIRTGGGGSGITQSNSRDSGGFMRGDSSRDDGAGIGDWGPGSPNNYSDSAIGRAAESITESLSGNDRGGNSGGNNNGGNNNGGNRR